MKIGLFDFDGSRSKVKINAAKKVTFDGAGRSIHSTKCPPSSVMQCTEIYSNIRKYLCKGRNHIKLKCKFHGETDHLCPKDDV